ncbi:MAG: BTAD domain-containing putative transcriptional regulator, partial [bacterium]
SLEIEGMVISSFLIGLIYKHPYPQEMKTWEERAFNLVRRSPDVGLRIRINSILSHYYSWTGDFEKYTACLRSLKRDEEKEEIPPFDRLNIHLCESVHNWLMGDLDGCRESVNRGLELASDTGIHIMSPYLICQMIFATLSSGEAEEAGKYMATYRGMFHPADLLNSLHYHIFAGWEALIRGDLRKAAADMELADKASIKAGTPFPAAVSKFGLANIYIEMDDHDRANEALNGVNSIAERMESIPLKFMCQTGWAYSALKKDDEKALLKHLKLMMAAGIDHVFCNFPMWRSSVMSRLFARAQEYGIEVDYARDIIRRRKLVPPVDTLQGLDNWPWPVRINTLGPFSLIRDDKPIRFSGKAQRRPLDLLKALIAFGGREVSSERLMDALWPDSDGDMAQNSFNAALHRLRKLMGIKEALTLQDGRLSLDPRYCWVDLWAFEDACEAADEAFSDGQPGDDFPGMAKRAIDLFGDRFLPDDLKPWGISSRERTRTGYSRIVTRLGCYLEGIDDHEKAIDYYLKALDMDDLAEDVYTSLMGCYEIIGRRADAVALYERCRMTLSEVLGVEPSPEIETIYRRIMS